MVGVGECEHLLDPLCVFVKFNFDRKFPFSGGSRGGNREKGSKSQDGKLTEHCWCGGPMRAGVDLLYV